MGGGKAHTQKLKQRTKRCHFRVTFLIMWGEGDRTIGK
jgi:hypothetical protein